MSYKAFNNSVQLLTMTSFASMFNYQIVNGAMLVPNDQAQRPPLASRVERDV